ncbi:MAG: ABC-F family ATP-binding cassette domain-containing protein [Calditrichia bacterium]
MIQLNNISYEIGERHLLRELDWYIDDGSRIALVGANGSGKTTLLRIVTGQLRQTSGRINKPSGYRIGYLPQEEVSLEDNQILSIVLAGRPDVQEIATQLREIQIALTAENNPQNQRELITKQGELENHFKLLDGYSLQAEAKKILAGLGFDQNNFGKPLSEFSGGWRMRVYLAKLLLQKPNLLLLDEPTNHLDLPSLEWLEEYLKKFSGSIVIVSHDRTFIDKIAREIVELENGVLQHFPGKFADFEKQKEMLAEQALQQQKNIQRYKAQQQKFIDRFRYKATKAAQVQSRIKKLEKLESVDLIRQFKNFSFSIKVDEPSYKDVLKFKDVSFRYDEAWIFHQLNFQISRGDKIALVGQNGAGKTTLTKLITGMLKPQEGNIKIGERVHIGYFAQHRIEELNLKNTIYQEVLETAADSHRPNIRNILGLFKFSGDDIDKKIEVLSGGEKARVSLAKIILSPVNFLIMDEPTNHLDIPSRQALENALREYDGTLLLISHDRFFLDKLVHRIFELKKQKLTEFEGNYTDYLHLRPAEDEVSPEVMTELKDKNVSRKSRDQKRKEAEARQAISRKRNEIQTRISEIEQQIEKLEMEKIHIESEMGKTETYQDAEKIIAIQARYKEINAQLKNLLAEWEKLHTEFEELMRTLQMMLDDE